MPDTRWKQRLQNFELAFRLLRGALEGKSLDELSDLEKEGLVQRFEYTFELAWKTLKDYLEYTGIKFEQVTPRNSIKQAFAAKVIDDGDTWIHMLEQRNLMAHTYNRENFEKAIRYITERYMGAMDRVFTFLKEKSREI